MDADRLIRCASAGDHAEVTALLRGFAHEGFAPHGLNERLSAVVHGGDRKQIASVLAQSAAEVGHAGVIAALASSSDRAILAGLSAPHPTSRFTPAMLASLHGHARVIRALGRCRSAAVLASLVAPCPVSRHTPAQLAAGKGFAEVIDALAEIADRAVQASLARHHEADGYTPAQRAAKMGWPAVVQALARAGGAALASLASSHEMLKFTPAQLAAEQGHSSFIAALASTGDRRVLDSLASAPSETGLTPAQLAASYGHTAVIEALADVADEDVWKSLKTTHPVDDLTPEQRARRLGHGNTADAVSEAVAAPYDERALLKTARADLEAQPVGGPESLLAADLRCPVTLEPFATAGSRRPVHLNSSGGYIPQQCVSESAANELRVHDMPDPFSREPFDGVLESALRVMLVETVADAYRQHPGDLTAARATALTAHTDYGKKLADVVSVVGKEREARTNLATLEATARTALSVHYRDILAGAVAGARTGAGAGASL